MNKHIMSHYGWVIVTSMIMAILIAFASPFGTFISDAMINITRASKEVADEAVDGGYENAKNHYKEYFDSIKQNKYINAGLYKLGSDFELMSKSWNDLTIEKSIHYKRLTTCPHEGCGLEMENITQATQTCPYCHRKISLAELGQRCAAYSNYDGDKGINVSSDFLIGDLVFHEDVTFIPENAFRKCNNLTSVTLKSVSQIDDYAFAGCKNLKTIIIENPNIKKINYGAFMSESINTVKFNGTKAQWNAINKNGIFESKTVIVECTDGNIEVFELM